MVKRNVFFLLLIAFIFTLIASVFFRKKDLELNYIGIKKLNASDLDKLTRDLEYNLISNNIKKINSAIKQNSLVEYVSTQKCSFFSLKCYLIEISEANPSFSIHESDTNKYYYFSTTGKQIYAAFDNLHSGNLNIYYKKKDFIKYVTEKKLAPFYLYDANINYILYSLNIFLKNKINVLRVELIGKKLQKVYIEGLDFPVIFSFNSNNKEVLKKELEKLKVMLKDLDGKYSDIMAINLSYGRVGSIIYSSNISSNK